MNKPSWWQRDSRDWDAWEKQRRKAGDVNVQKQVRDEMERPPWRLDPDERKNAIRDAPPLTGDMLRKTLECLVDLVRRVQSGELQINNFVLEAQAFNSKRHLEIDVSPTGSLAQPVASPSDGDVISRPVARTWECTKNSGCSCESDNVAQGCVMYRGAKSVVSPGSSFDRAWSCTRNEMCSCRNDVEAINCTGFRGNKPAFKRRVIEQIIDPQTGERRFEPREYPVYAGIDRDSIPSDDEILGDVGAGPVDYKAVNAGKAAGPPRPPKVKPAKAKNWAKRELDLD